MEAYLDNSATTRCSDRAFALMQKVLLEDYGNPSSLHMKGVEAERYVKAAREKIAKTLKVTEKEIIFTSGGRSGLMMFTTTKPCRTQTSRSMTLHSGRETCTELSTA